MKKILIMCGTGIATSTVVKMKLTKWLCEKHLENKVKIYQSKMSDELDRLDDYDIILSTIIVSNRIKAKIIDGIPLLTGIDEEKVYQMILEKIKERSKK